MTDHPTTPYSKLADFIMKEAKIRISVHDNASCLKCGRVEKKMIRIGAFTMCSGCAFNEGLVTDTTSEDFKAKYVLWIAKYKETLK